MLKLCPILMKLGPSLVSKTESSSARFSEFSSSLPVRKSPRIAERNVAEKKVTSIARRATCPTFWSKYRLAEMGSVVGG